MVNKITVESGNSPVNVHPVGAATPDTQVDQSKTIEECTRLLDLAVSQAGHELKKMGKITANQYFIDITCQRNRISKCFNPN